MGKEVDALAKLYAYILWLVPKLEKFPRNQKFLVEAGWRIMPCAMG